MLKILDENWPIAIEPRWISEDILDKIQRIYRMELLSYSFVEKNSIVIFTEFEKNTFKLSMENYIFFHGAINFQMKNFLQLLYTI